MDQYEIKDVIGRGAYGIVCKARSHVTGEIVAIKKIEVDQHEDGLPGCAIREIAILKQLQHPNIVRLYGIISSEFDLCMVFEHYEMDLGMYMRITPIKPMIIKKFLYQLLRGIAYCHSNRVLHRDLKPCNLLINTQTHVLKIADFGLARTYGDPRRLFTPKVATPGYMAPEILLDNRKYSRPMDLWSIGCIFAEMVNGVALFRSKSGTSEGQLEKIFSLLGLPDEQSWPGVTTLPSFVSLKFPKYQAKNFADIFPALEPAGIDLLSKMICLDPKKRITARAALQQEYFCGVAVEP